MQVEIAGSAISRLYLGCISANSRLPLGYLSGISRVYLGYISAVSRRSRSRARRPSPSCSSSSPRTLASASRRRRCGARRARCRTTRLCTCAACSRRITDPTSTSRSRSSSLTAPSSSSPTRACPRPASRSPSSSPPSRSPEVRCRGCAEAALEGAIAQLTALRVRRLLWPLRWRAPASATGRLAPPPCHRGETMATTYTALREEFLQRSGRAALLLVSQIVSLFSSHVTVELCVARREVARTVTHTPTRGRDMHRARDRLSHAAELGAACRGVPPRGPAVPPPATTRTESRDRERERRRDRRGAGRRGNAEVRPPRLASPCAPRQGTMQCASAPPRPSG